MTILISDDRRDAFVTLIYGGVSIDHGDGPRTHDTYNVTGDLSGTTASTEGRELGPVEAGHVEELARDAIRLAKDRAL